MTNNQVSNKACLEVPNDFFEYVGQASKPGNSLYKCLNCPIGLLSNQKTISCHNKSRQNLKKHIRACHNMLAAKFEQACIRLTGYKFGKRKSYDEISVKNSNDSVASTFVKRKKLVIGPSITKTSLDTWVIEYFSDCVLPLHHVDTPGFRLFVNRLTHQRLYPRCRQTLTKQLEEQYLFKKAELKQKLSTIEIVCTTADSWTSMRRSFLGVTVHWIDQDTLERKECCLALRDITGYHTYDALAEELESIHQEFGIIDKICYTLTDSGSNFIESFNHFSTEEEVNCSNAENEKDDNENENDEDTHFEQINDLLNIPTEDEEQTIYKLPPHRRCACHLLNLIASKDASKTDSVLKRISQQTLTKLTAIWNEQNRSPIAADIIEDAIGFLLMTPVEKRWNSIYNAIVKVNEIFSNAELGTKFDKVFDTLGVKKLTQQQKLFLVEYVEVMTPLCHALNILHGEKYIGLGFLLPTINVVETQLKMMISRLSNPLTICEPLAKSILNSLQLRFSSIFNDPQAKLAAVLHPKFKTYWIDDLYQKNEVISQIRRQLQQQNVSIKIEEPPQLPLESQDFFSILTSKRDMEASLTDNADDVTRYLSDPSSSLSSLSNYQSIRKLYVKFNTGLPASSAVERLFSLGGRVFTLPSSKLSSSHFEMMVFLRAAKW